MTLNYDALAIGFVAVVAIVGSAVIAIAIGIRVTEAKESARQWREFRAEADRRAAMKHSSNWCADAVEIAAPAAGAIAGTILAVGCIRLGEWLYRVGRK